MCVAAIHSVIKPTHVFPHMATFQIITSNYLIICHVVVLADIYIIKVEIFSFSPEISETFFNSKVNY